MFLLLLHPLARADDSGFHSEVVPWLQTAPEHTRLRGYAELRGSWTDADGTPWLLVERLRPTLEFKPGERFSLAATAEAHLEQGRYAPAEAEALLREQLGDETLELLLDTYGCTLQTERTIDAVGDVASLERLYADLNLPWVDLRVGRQGLNWGSALVYNPTDVFAEVIVAEPWKERQGVDSARATVPLGESAQVVGVVGLNQHVLDEPDGARGGLRATLSREKLDASVVGYTDGDRSLIGLDLKGDAGVGWWLEAGFDGDLAASAGLDYSFAVGQVLYVAAQLSYDAGALKPEDYDWTALQSQGADLGTCTSAPEGSVLDSAGTTEDVDLGRWHGLMMVNWTLNDTVGLSATGLANLEDGTGLVFPSVSYKPGSRLALNGGVQVLLGEDGEFRPPAEALAFGPVDLSPLLPTWTASVWARWSL